jgi:3-phosphoshikimate 1-carboxyvinyltransferase
MNLSLSPTSQVRGTVSVPGDKSMSHRAAIFGAMAQGTTRIRGFLRAGDTLGTLAILRQLGAKIEDNGAEILVHGDGLDAWQTPQTLLDCGNSGTTMRLMLGVLAGRPFQST